MDGLCAAKAVFLLSLGCQAFPEIQLARLADVKEFLLSEVAQDLRSKGKRVGAVRFSFRLQFLSQAGICHVAVHWQSNEVLLFSDPAHVGLVDPRDFRTSTALEHHRKNIQLGLNWTGCSCRTHCGRAVHEGDMDPDQQQAFFLQRGKWSSHRNPFWKFVVPQISYFAWLPAGIAHSFCFFLHSRTSGEAWSVI